MARSSKHEGIGLERAFLKKASKQLGLKRLKRYLPGVGGG